MLTWTVPLDERPRIEYAGVGVFGERPLYRYTLANHWTLHLYRYDAALVIDGVPVPIRSGSAGIIAPGKPHEYRFSTPGCVHACFHYSLPDSQEGEPIPAMQELGADFERLYGELEGAIGVFPLRPRRAEAWLWEMLWLLAERSRRPNAALVRQRPGRVVELAIRSIELRLAEPLQVGALARQCGVSPNHLAKLFRTTLGETVTGYIRRRRVERATQLLLHSGLPIKSIAREVGIPDPHAFNKTIRRTLGASPRAVRRGELPGDHDTLALGQ